MRRFDTKERRKVRSVLSTSGQVGHSNPHLDCPLCEKSRQVIMLSAISPDLTFAQAFPLWLESRVRINETTRKDYERYAKCVSKFFSATPLAQIHIGMLREYQKERAAGNRQYFVEPAGAIVINKEIGTLLQVRRRAHIDDKLEDEYEPLPLPYWRPPKSITDDLEKKFLEALRSRPDWEVAYLCAVVFLKTGVVGAEFRNTKIEHFDTVTRHLHVHQRVKNQFRVRRVPLVPAAYFALERLLAIAHEKGAARPEHYLLPFRISRGHWDPCRPATYGLIKKIWKEAREIAGVPSSFTPHSPRHQVNTKLYENGADDMTVMAIMGHQSRKMSEYYSHIRDQRKREVMDKALGVLAG